MRLLLALVFIVLYMILATLELFRTIPYERYLFLALPLFTGFVVCIVCEMIADVKNYIQF